MFCYFKFSSLLPLLLLISAISARPNSDFVFREEEDAEPDQILPAADGGRLRIDDNEIIQRKLQEGNYFQGDIVLLQEQQEYIESKDTGSELSTRTGVLSEYYRWPKDSTGKVIVTYRIAASSGYSSYQKSVLKSAMKDFEKYTCVRFRERTNQEDFIHIFSGDGCYSNLGKIGGQQDLSLKKNGCFSKGIIIHEMIHALGYDHMHSHAKRDDFIEIKWTNIQKEQFSQFDKVSPKKFGSFGTEYDYYSVMHYDKDAFSKNGQDTIVPKDAKYKDIIGQRIGLSIGDVKRINNMYNCDNKL